MTTEEKLKELILKRYHSIREFTINADIPYTTVDSIFRRGIGNSSVTNIIKICKVLGISVDALADGEIKSINDRASVQVNNIEVQDILDTTKNMLIHGGSVTLDGKPIQKDGLDSIIDAMDIGMEMAKKRMK